MPGDELASIRVRSGDHGRPPTDSGGRNHRSDGAGYDEILTGFDPEGGRLVIVCRAGLGIGSEHTVLAVLVRRDRTQVEDRQSTQGDRHADDTGSRSVDEHLQGEAGSIIPCVGRRFEFPDVGAPTGHPEQPRAVLEGVDETSRADPTSSMMSRSKAAP